MWPLALEAHALRDLRNTRLTVLVVNPLNRSVSATVRVGGARLEKGSVGQGQLLTSGNRSDDNGPDTPLRVAPSGFTVAVDHAGAGTAGPVQFPAISFTTIQFQLQA